MIRACRASQLVCAKLVTNEFRSHFHQGASRKTEMFQEKCEGAVHFRGSVVLA